MERLFIAMRALFGIREKEFTIFMMLDRPMTLKEIAEQAGLALPSASRYLNSLAAAGLVVKVPKCCIGRRGRYFIYQRTPAGSIMKMAEMKAGEMVSIIKNRIR